MLEGIHYILILKVFNTSSHIYLDSALKYAISAAFVCSQKFIFHNLPTALRLIILLLVISPWASLGRNQSPVRRTVWLWYAAPWASFLRVVCHCFPPRLDVPTLRLRCLHARNDAKDPSSERWNYG